MIYTVQAHDTLSKNDMEDKSCQHEINTQLIELEIKINSFMKFLIPHMFEPNHEDFLFNFNQQL